MHIEDSTTGREYERVTIGSPVLRDIMVEMVDSEQRKVMVLTENQVRFLVFDIFHGIFFILKILKKKCNKILRLEMN